MTTKRTRSGPNIPNAKRGTVPVLLRLPPATAAAFRTLAARWELSLAETLAEVLRRCGVETDDDD